jgi:hypothetical protein
VVQRAVGAVDDRDVVAASCPPGQPHAELVAVAVEHLLGQPQPEHVDEERGCLGHLLGVDQHVVHPRRRDAGQVGRRHRRRVVLAQDVAGLLDVPDQLHDLAGRHLEPDRLALPDRLPLDTRLTWQP